MPMPHMTTVVDDQVLDSTAINALNKVVQLHDKRLACYLYRFLETRITRG
jgi:hypothetical protein